MADYTVIIDDSDDRVLYGPDGDSWSPFHNNSTYQGTVHRTWSGDANLTFAFTGGREVIIRGELSGVNNTAGSAAYPIFKVGWKNTLGCSPDPPQNGAQFLCSTSLSSAITNRTLTMFVNPDAAIQEFHIDYIRHGSSSQAAMAENGTVAYVKAPDNTTLGLSFKGDWKYQSIGGETDFKKAMRTSTASSTATYLFVGDSFAWWGCCMPVGTSTEAANVTYSIDGGDISSVQLDANFIQGPHCKDESLLFQVQPDQIQPGNHIVNVVYHGDPISMPLTLCALAATPVDFKQLDIGPNQSSSPGGGNSVQGPHQKSHIGITIGVVFGLATTLIVFSVGIIWWRGKQAKSRKPKGSTDSLSSFQLHPTFGLIDPEKQDLTIPGPALVSAVSSTGLSTATLSIDEQDENSETRYTDTATGPSQLESRPPSYRTTGSGLDH